MHIISFLNLESISVKSAPAPDAGVQIKFESPVQTLAVIK